MHTPSGLYERILEVRQRDDLSASAAIEVVHKELLNHAAEVWKDCGTDYLRRIEREHRKRGVGHGTAVNHSRRADVEDDEDVGQSPTAGHSTHADVGHISPANQSEHAVANGSAGGQRHHATQSKTAPGTPWFDRVDWSSVWDVEVEVPGVGRKRSGDVTRRDLRSIHESGMEDIEARRARIRNVEQIILAMKSEDETLPEALRRMKDGDRRTVLFREAIEGLLGAHTNTRRAS